MCVCVYGSHGTYKLLISCASGLEIYFPLSVRAVHVVSHIRDGNEPTPFKAQAQSFNQCSSRAAQKSMVYFIDKALINSSYLLSFKQLRRMCTILNGANFWFRQIYYFLVFFMCSEIPCLTTRVGLDLFVIIVTFILPIFLHSNYEFPQSAACIDACCCIRIIFMLRN